MLVQHIVRTTGPRFVLGLVLTGALAAPALSQPSGTVGLRLDLPTVDASMRMVDLELTMYTRGAGPDASPDAPIWASRRSIGATARSSARCRWP